MLVLYCLSAGELAHCVYFGLVGDGDVWSHCSFVGVTGDLADNGGRDAQFEGSTDECSSSSVRAEDLPFRVNFVISYIVSVITVLHR